MNREEIEKILPVRDPYLWLDEVVEISDTQIHARKFLDPELEIFRAHYVDFPLFPGALQCEAAFQARDRAGQKHQVPADGSSRRYARHSRRDSGIPSTSRGVAR